MNFLRILVLGLLTATLSACSYVPRIVTEYRIDVQQGNVLNQEQVAQLKPGQTRDQVRFILGTPMLADPFHQSRWDYLYRFESGVTGEVETRRMVVYFDDAGRLQRVSGDVTVATVAELAAPVSRTDVVELGTLPAEGAPALPPVEDDFWARMRRWLGVQ